MKHSSRIRPLTIFRIYKKPTIKEYSENFHPIWGNENALLGISHSFDVHFLRMRTPRFFFLEVNVSFQVVTLFSHFFKCESGTGIRAMLEMIDTPPHKIVFLGPGCSVATTPVAEAAPYWQAVQVS